MSTSKKPPSEPRPTSASAPAPQRKRAAGKPGVKPTLAQLRRDALAATQPRPGMLPRAPRRGISGAIERLFAHVEWSHVRERLIAYAKLARMHKPIGAALLLWPTWWALWLSAGDFPPWPSLIVFTFGVFLMRSAGCVINDYADRKLDPQVARTRTRPMATGTVSSGEALILFFTLITLAFLLVLLTNKLTIELSFVGAFLAATYPFVKRFTHLPQVYLGAAFGWSIPMAFAAVTNTLPPLCWLLFLANMLFSTIYDTQYAMVDRDDDIKAGAKSTAILFGDADLAIVGILMLTFLGAMTLVAQRGHLHWPYFAGLCIAAVLFAWQLWHIRKRDREACFAAFRNNNWVGMVLWVAIVFSLAVK